MDNRVDIPEEIRSVLTNPVVSISANVEEKYIVTTEDKVRILYDEYNSIRKITSDALGWLGVFITLLITDITCSFKSFWFLSANMVQAMFYWGTIITLFLFGKSEYTRIKNNNKLKFEFFIDRIKGGSQTEEKR